MNPEIAKHEAVTVAKLRDDLLAKYPELHEDEQALADTLSGLTNFNEMVSAVVMSSLDDKVMYAAITARMEDLQLRAERYGHREARKRQLATDLMALSGVRKITEPEFTISLKASPPKVIITDEFELPDAFKKVVPATWRPDKNAIKDALKAGVSVPGAALSNQPDTISIRTK